MMQEVVMPDNDISIEEALDYGYDGEGQVLPLKEQRAKDLWDEGLAIYKLYNDGGEGMIDDISEISDHAEHGGLFGVEREDWEHYLN